jgi:hypothetical protein
MTKCAKRQFYSVDKLRGQLNHLLVDYCSEIRLVIVLPCRLSELAHQHLVFYGKSRSTLVSIRARTLEFNNTSALLYHNGRSVILQIFAESVCA